MSDATPLTSLNAIKLSARQVAGTFVAPPAFETLLHADNVVLTGPRGSGKTTLLKMMQSEALERWAGPDADVARDSARAIGVFIGADRTWNEQLAMPGEEISESIRTALTAAAFTTHVFRSIGEAMDYRLRGPQDGVISPHRRAVLAPEDERILANRLSTLAATPLQLNSIASFRAALSDRLGTIGELRTRARRGVEVEPPDWVDLDCLVIADAMVEAFNLTALEPDQKWALLFDELELAPVELVENLLGALRGAQPRLLFKLSLAPANERFAVLEHEHAPVPGQDYEHVPLTYARKLPALKFAKALVSETISRVGGLSAPPVERILGHGALDSRDDFDGDEVTPSNAYSVGSPLWKSMDRLRKHDKTFENYLAQNGIDLDHLDNLDPKKRAARLRKIRNIVVVREFFRADDGRRRSRKSFSLYAGADSILSLPDGNPRMIIALVRQLFPVIDARTVNGRVSVPMQSAATEATLTRFLSLLEAQQAVKVHGKSVALMDLVDRIGDSLAVRLVEQPFSDNVALTFRVPKDLHPEIKTLFIRGINAGAFINIPPKNGNARLSGDVVGRQFRLSHMLATKYGLPIHLTPATSLADHIPQTWLQAPGRGQIVAVGGEEALFALDGES
ncbi:hypothetical protein GCM10023350_02450 [Nocardioides endophyticus]|uniref:ATP-binding protein n=1 Tax=Nocardioides endophyticus TaxID=1353775 RepID=A0ABP8Y8J5_9ACTN